MGKELGASPLRLARPLATAYVLGLLSSTGPRVITVLFLLGKRKLDLRAASQRLRNILRRAIAIHRFPTFCGVLVGGSTLLQAPINALIRLLLHAFRPARSSLDRVVARQLARFLAALISASVSFSLLNSGPSKDQSTPSAAVSHRPTHLDFVKPSPFDEPPETGSLEIDNATLSAKALSRNELAGKTIDLTLFSVIRALDIIISAARNDLPSEVTSKLGFVTRYMPSALFCISAATIMHAWVYSPSRLPETYNRWISAAADVDHRLLLALRHARYGTWVYGKDTGMASLLGSMSRDYGLEESLGDPAQTIPLPCEIVHMRRGKSCEAHAFLRFCRGWVFAAKMYAPLQLIVLARYARQQRRPREKLNLRLPLPVVLRAAGELARSSAFLGAFIALFYYGICLSRTRLGPKLFSYKTVTPQMWDSGLCILSGCLLCGSSILVEQSRKRFEIMLFVLPRAAATWFPRRYLPENRWKEHVAFALSTAAVMTVAQEDPKRVRGVLGNVLSSVMRID